MPNKFSRFVFNKSFVKFFFVVAVYLISSFQIAFAQTLSKEQFASIQKVINTLLLTVPSAPIVLDLDEVENRRYGYQYGSGDDQGGLEIHFEGQEQSVTLCFDTEDIQNGEVSVQLNGQSLGTLSAGENCFTFSAGQQLNGPNILILTHNNPGDRWGVSNIGVEYTQQNALGLQRLSRLQWDEAAVRKVLKLFAFGGHAHDDQIDQWASTNPEQAIAEMLNFSKYNAKLSPLAPGEKYSDHVNRYGTFTEFANFLGSNSSKLPFPLDTPNDDGNLRGTRHSLGLDGYNFEGSFFRFASIRGLNPFRQRIGLWETNYHLATNLEAGVTRRQMARYYDEIMNAHEADMPYQDVLAVAAKTAAVAMQYGHRRNRWVNDECLCNDDFAREIHQLFFGILGDTDPEGGSDHHENVTIKESAKMLTDMNVDYNNSLGGYPNEVTFGTEEHHLAPLYILNTNIFGANASEKIDNLVDVSIEHPESLAALPVMIISGLADDNITPAKATQIRAAWAAMGSNKNFLNFIRVYATSTLFHSPNQYKYLSSFERGLLMANKLYTSNTESLLDRTGISGSIERENAEFFRPLHNVFGGQTSLEAADSALIFEESYNKSTDDEYAYRSRVGCDECDFGQPWLKDWSLTIPAVNGQYPAAHVAQWLWNHVIGNLDNYSELEKAHMITLLGSARSSSNQNSDQSFAFDLNHLLCIGEDILDNDDVSNKDVSLARLVSYDGYGRHCRMDSGDYDENELAILNRAFTGADMESQGGLDIGLPVDSQDPGRELLQMNISALLNELGAQNMLLGSSAVQPQKRYANERIQAAISFIFTTPFIFAEERK